MPRPSYRARFARVFALLTGELAGPGADCKSASDGFDSHPGLHNKRFPADYSHAELAALVIEHRNAAAAASTERSEIRDRLITAQKELSALKRARA